jgi:hypothetical protein
MHTLLEKYNLESVVGSSQDAIIKGSATIVKPYGSKRVGVKSSPAKELKFKDLKIKYVELITRFIKRWRRKQICCW